MIEVIQVRSSREANPEIRSIAIPPTDSSFAMELLGYAERGYKAQLGYPASANLWPVHDRAMQEGVSDIEVPSMEVVPIKELARVVQRIDTVDNWGLECMEIAADSKVACATGSASEVYAALQFGMGWLVRDCVSGWMLRRRRIDRRLREYQGRFTYRQYTPELYDDRQLARHAGRLGLWAATD